MQEHARVKSGSAWTHLLIAVLITPFSALALFWGATYAIAELDEGWHPVWFGDSSNAQIIVLNHDQSADGFTIELIPVSFVANYRAAHPECTFVIPVDRKDRVQKRLETDLKVSWSTFEIKPTSEGQEEITLFFMDRADDSHGSQYKATKERVDLERYRYVADRSGIGIVLFALFLTFVIHALLLGFLLVRAIYWWRRGRRAGDEVTI